MGVVDCVVGDWEQWSHCSLEIAQQERKRRIATQMKNGGVPCSGPLKEIAACVKKVDCVVSDWTGWDECDKSCDGGQHSRHRQVVSNPMNGGKSCPTEVVQTRG